MQHRTQLDGLRAAAVLTVLAFHFWPELAPSGRRGVQLFFVLSGFLITSILLDCRTLVETGAAAGWRPVLRNFYTRRLLRIAPAYFLVLLVLALVPSSGIQGSLPVHLAFLSNFYFAMQQAWRPWPVIHLWSLATEEQFYLVWPLLIMHLPRRALAPAIGSVVFGAVASRWLGYVAGLEHDTTLLVLPWASFDALGLGALLAVIAARPLQRFILERAALAAGVLLASYQIALAAAWVGDDFAVSYIVVEFAWAVAFAGVVSKAATGFRGLVGAAMSSRPAAYIGRISYGIYLYHVPLHFLGSAAARRLGLPFPTTGPLLLAMIGSVSVICAAASWRWFEGPINLLKHRFPYRAGV